MVKEINKRLTLGQVLPRMTDRHEAWCIKTLVGDGYLYYYNGETLYCGYDVPSLEKLFERKVHDINIKRNKDYSRLMKGTYEDRLEFVISGYENGII
jgi:hypothetical protein